MRGESHFQTLNVLYLFRGETAVTRDADDAGVAFGETTEALFVHFSRADVGEVIHHDMFAPLGIAQGKADRAGERTAKVCMNCTDRIGGYGYGTYLLGQDVDAVKGIKLLCRTFAVTVCSQGAQPATCVLFYIFPCLGECRSVEVFLSLFGIGIDALAKPAFVSMMVEALFKIVYAVKLQGQLLARIRNAVGGVPYGYDVGVGLHEAGHVVGIERDTLSSVADDNFPRDVSFVDIYSDFSRCGYSDGSFVRFVAFAFECAAEQYFSGIVG